MRWFIVIASLSVSLFASADTVPVSVTAGTAVPELSDGVTAGPGIEVIADPDDNPSAAIPAVDVDGLTPP